MQFPGGRRAGGRGAGEAVFFFLNLGRLASGALAG